ncbi:MAG: hypothetical protein WDM84_05915 [Bauldia sp.]
MPDASTSPSAATSAAATTTRPSPRPHKSSVIRFEPDPGQSFCLVADAGTLCHRRHP